MATSTAPRFSDTRARSHAEPRLQDTRLVDRLIEHAVRSERRIERDRDGASEVAGRRDRRGREIGAVEIDPVVTRDQTGRRDGREVPSRTVAGVSGGS